MNEVYAKSVKAALPEYRQGELQNPKDISYKGCLVFPLFMAVDGIVPYYHIRSAFWAAHSFIKHSNIFEKQIPIFFYIDECVYASALPDFVNAGVDPSMCITYRQPDRPPEIGSARWLSQKLYITLDDKFDAYETVTFVDTDLFLAMSNESTDVFDISELFVHKDKTKFGVFRIPSMPDKRIPYFDNTSVMSYREECQRNQEEIKKHFNRDIATTYNINGYINSFCPRLLESDYRAFIKKSCRLFWNDEVVNSLYLQTGGVLFDKYVDMRVKIAGKTDVFHACRKELPYFLTHLDLQYLTNPTDVDLWHRLIGVKEINIG